MSCESLGRLSDAFFVFGCGESIAIHDSCKATFSLVRW